MQIHPEELEEAAKRRVSTTPKQRMLQNEEFTNEVQKAREYLAEHCPMVLDFIRRQSEPVLGTKSQMAAIAGKRQIYHLLSKGE